MARLWIQPYEGSNGKRKPDEYHDKIDFIFCELFPGYVKKCFAYYHGKGKPLRDLPETTDRQIRRWEKMLLVGVTTAYDWFCEKRRVEEWSWEELRKVVLAA